MAQSVANCLCINPVLLILFTKTQKQIARQFETEPTAGHARRDFQEIRNDAFVQASHAFLRHDDSDGIPYRFILISHSRHRVDLESASENVAAFNKHDDVVGDK